MSLNRCYWPVIKRVFLNSILPDFAKHWLNKLKKESKLEFGQHKLKLGLRPISIQFAIFPILCEVQNH